MTVLAPQTSLFSLLATRRFLPMFFVQFLGAFNDNFFRSAIFMLVTFRLAETQGYDARLIGSLGAGLFILPYFLFSATAGAVVDRFEKTALVRSLKGAEFILVIGAGAALFIENVPFMLVMLFLLGIQAAFFGPVKYSILPKLVATHELVLANGWVEGATFLAILFGTIAGGALIVLPSGAWIVAAAMMLLSLGGWLISYAIPRAGVGDANVKIDWLFLRAIGPLLREAARNNVIYRSILGISWFWFVGLIFLSLLPNYVKDIINGDPWLVNVMLGLFSLGIGVGSVACAKLLKGRVHARYAPLGAIIMGVAILAIYALSTLIPQNSPPVTAGTFFRESVGIALAFAFFTLAAAGGLFTVPLYALMQTCSDESRRARVIAANNVVNALFMVASSIFTSVMFKIHFDIVQIFLMLAAANFVAAFLARKFLPRG